MDERLQALADRQEGVFAAAEARRLGVDDTQLRSAIRRGQLVRVRRGAYADEALWRAAPPDERYRLAVLATARTRPGDVVSHHAALALHGLPLWQYDHGRIDLLTGIRQGVARDGVHLHPRRWTTAAPVGGVPVTSVARAVVRTALTMGRPCAVVAGDAALRQGRVTPAELVDEVAAVSPHQGRGRALAAVLDMDEKAESVGESRCRMVLQDLGLTIESQVVLRDHHGAFVARVDFLVDGVVLEFDGRLKYRADANQGGDEPAPEEVVWREKRREDSVRRLGYPVERVVWDDLTRSGLIGARLRAARILANTPGNRQPPVVAATGA